MSKLDIVLYIKGFPDNDWFCPNICPNATYLSHTCRMTSIPHAGRPIGEPKTARQGTTQMPFLVQFQRGSFLLMYPDLFPTGDAALLWICIPDQLRQFAYDHRADPRTQTYSKCLRDCKHKLPDTITVTEEIHGLFKNKYQLTTITPNCAKDRECGQWRQEIFDRAYRESWLAFDRHKSFRAAMKAKKETWDKITAEYESCPFCES